MKKYIKASILIVVAILFWNCTPESDTEGGNVEPNKDVTGSWKIVEAYRNGKDLYSNYNFTKFRIKFKDDNTYTIENYLPFVIRDNGQYSLDDPQYPFKLSFDSNAGEKIAIPFLFPIKNGERYLSLTFSPGCASNDYTYVFKRVEE